MSLITVITAFYGRQDDFIREWFASVTQISRHVICVYHDLYGKPEVKQEIESSAHAANVNVTILKWGKFDLIRNGFSELWNQCIDRVTTEWFMPLGSDEYIKNPKPLLDECRKDNACIFVELSCPLSEPGVKALRCYRKAHGFRYNGLVHEEAFDSKGVNAARLKYGMANTVCVHKRSNSHRGLQHVLLLKAFFNPALRGGTNDWWFDTYSTGNFVNVLASAKEYCGIIGANLLESLEIPMNWDYWRSQYDVWPFEAHRLFYDEVFRNYPSQRYGDCDYVANNLAGKGPLEVVELGGWNGFVAVNVLGRIPAISTWNNYDICAPAIEHSMSHERLYSHTLSDWPWNTELHRGNAFVALHTLEHMKARDIRALLETNPQWRVACVEVPVGEADGCDWTGYNGTHILDIGWSSLIKLFGEFGFRVENRMGEKVTFIK